MEAINVQATGRGWHTGRFRWRAWTTRPIRLQRIRAGAHGARLGARIEGAACTSCSGENCWVASCNEVGLSVTGGIPAGYNGIFGLQDNPIVFIHQHGPEGMVAALAGTPGDGYGCLQVFNV